MSSHGEVRKVVELINDSRIAMLTTLDGDAHLVSRPLTVLEVENDGDLWFFTHDATSQATHVIANNAVNAAFSTGKEWVSVSGSARIVRDQDEIDRLWNSAIEAWFPDGPQTPGLILLKVEADSAEYWDTPGTAATAVRFVKAKLTDQRIDAGESKTVEL